MSLGFLMSIMLSILLWSCSATLAKQFRIINHDTVTSLEPSATDLESYWQPRLVIGGHACHSFPAVDSNGRISGGLSASGDGTDECSTSTGQCYVRTARLPAGVTALMYSWYFVCYSHLESRRDTDYGLVTQPKAEKKDILRSEEGHRHSWQNVVIFVAITPITPTTPHGKLKKVCFSETLDYTCYNDPPTVDDIGKSAAGKPMTTGRHVKVKYVRKGTNLHPKAQILERAAADDFGDLQPLVDWQRMPTKARDALADYAWGDGVVVPFGDAVFDIFVEAAWATAVTPADDD